MATQPNLLTQPFAENGDKNVIPNTTATAGAFSQDKGFPAETSLPLGAGGVAPSRQDFNGAFNMLSRLAFYQQKGWAWHFDNTQDYYAGCIVVDDTDGKMYRCINDVSAGGSVPSVDSTHWIAYDYLHRLLQRNTAYNVGDIVYSPQLNGGEYLECTTAGTTDSVEPDFSGGGISLSPEDTITDGTVTWTVRWHKEAWSMPSTHYITLSNTLTNYTAPADGYLSIGVRGSLSQSNYGRLNCGAIYAITYPVSTGTTAGCTIPLAQGQTASISWGGTLTDKYVYFTYSQNN